MAAACFQQEKQSEAFVILEALEKANRLTPDAKLLYAKLLSKTTELVKAAQYYQALKDADPSFVDEELEEELAAFLLEPGNDDPNDPRRVVANDESGEPIIDVEKAEDYI